MKRALILISFMASSANSLCCPWTPSLKVKCVCGDGSHVAPWQCCGTSTCNVFCCNCKGDCRRLVDWRGYSDVYGYEKVFVVSGMPLFSPKQISEGYEIVKEHGKPVCRTIERRPCHILSKCYMCIVQKPEKEDDGLEFARVEEQSMREVNLARKKRSVMLVGLDRNPDMMEGLEGTILKFQMLDLDNSGSLDAIEVARMFGDLDEDSLDLAKEVVLDLDKNMDGAINPIEFDQDLEGIL